MDKMLLELWNLAETIIKMMSSLWEWLSNDLTIKISWLKIPLILPDGVEFTLGWSPIHLAGAGLLILVGLWLFKGLIF